MPEWLVKPSPMSKSTVDQIRERFDGDVERFSNLETGQSATIDAPLSLSLIAEAVARVAVQLRRAGGANSNPAPVSLATRSPAPF
jgi:hypothetical protein